MKLISLRRLFTFLFVVVSPLLFPSLVVSRCCRVSSVVVHSWSGFLLLLLFLFLSIILFLFGFCCLFLGFLRSFGGWRFSNAEHPFQCHGCFVHFFVHECLAFGLLLHIHTPINKFSGGLSSLHFTKICNDNTDTKRYNNPKQERYQNHVSSSSRSLFFACRGAAVLSLSVAVLLWWSVLCHGRAGGEKPNEEFSRAHFART